MLWIMAVNDSPTMCMYSTCTKKEVCGCYGWLLAKEILFLAGNKDFLSSPEKPADLVVFSYLILTRNLSGCRNFCFMC